MPNRRTPNQNLPFVATETTILMIELRVKAYPRQLEEAKNNIKKAYNAVHDYEKSKLGSAKKKLKQLQDKYKEDINILVQHGYNPITLLR